MAYILIISIEDDNSTGAVIDWINFIGKKDVIRIDIESFFELIKLKLTDEEVYFEFNLEGKVYNSKEIKSFWFRKGNISYNLGINFENIDEDFKEQVSFHINREKRSLTHALHTVLNNKKHLGAYRFASANKIESLITAQSLSINIPYTFVCKDKNELSDFSKEELITKGIQEAATFNYIKNKEKDQKEFYGMCNYTTEINASNVGIIPDEFQYSKFQKKLNKAFELRIFFLTDRFYSMAIFSQNNPKTSVDFRHYDDFLPNRTVPFKLPNDISYKLLKLMKKLNLNTGSIDMVVTKEGKYVFLEVNPVGQFGMVSYPCNYYLEKKIADYLSN